MATYKYLDLNGLEYLCAKIKEYVAEYYDGNIQAQVNAKLDEMLEDGTLQTLADTYFAGIDVQEEINNKLDEMAEDGTLAEIIGEYINSSVEVYSPKLTLSGDLTVLKLKDGNNYKYAIVDFGNYSTDYYNNMTQKLIDNGFTKFDYAIVSHYHNDHVGSLLSMIGDSRFDFSDCTFYLPPTPDYSSWVGSTSYIPQNEIDIKAALTSAGIEYVVPTSSTEVEINSTATLKFYNVITDDFSTYYDIVYNGNTEYNNFSMVAEFNVNNQKLLFTGDISSEAQRVIMTQGVQSCDWIKAPHHAQGAYRRNDSLAGLDENFVNKIIKGRCIVITGSTDTSWAWNSLTRLIPTYRTESNGDINCLIKDGNISVETANGGAYNPTIDINGFFNTLNADGILNLGDTTYYKELQSGDNLDEIVTEGTYGIRSSSTLSGLSNIPSDVTGVFKLIVFRTYSNGRAIQVIVENDSPNIYIRRGRHEGSTNTWTYWYKVCTDGKGTSIPANSDLDNFTQGVYYCNGGATAQTLYHCPTEINAGFRLNVDVTIADNRIEQTISTNSGTVSIYKRFKTSGGWGQWYKLDAATVEQRIPSE